jgi:hypothetical protein
VLSAFVIHGPVQDHVPPVSQPIVPIIHASRRARHRQGVAWRRPSFAASRRATASLDDGCARRCCRIKVGTKKHARSNKETDTSAKSRSPPPCLLTPSLIQGWARKLRRSDAAFPCTRPRRKRRDAAFPAKGMLMSDGSLTLYARSQIARA